METAWREHRITQPRPETSRRQHNTGQCALEHLHPNILGGWTDAYCGAGALRSLIQAWLIETDRSNNQKLLEESSEVLRGHDDGLADATYGDKHIARAALILRLRLKPFVNA